ncbi:MAG TPA: ABC transporter ATP-binding protein [candidate division Zixibacteria bacterium]|nr:ABC transporter ATP-binding protein [candidate division Zixibacteria bacterium]
MNLIGRTFRRLKPYWFHVIVSSLSAALHALFAGLLVWMAGPLLMTLFETSQIEKNPSAGPDVVQQTQTSNQETAGYEDDIVNKLEGELDFLARTKNGIKDKLNDLLTGQTRKATLINFCVVILLIGVASNFFIYFQGFFMAFVQQSVIRDFRNDLFVKYQELSISFFHRQRTGQLVSRVTNDVLVLNETIDLGFNRLVIDTLTVLMLSVFLILLSWKLTILAALVMPIVFGFIYWMGKKLRKYSARSQEKMADVNSVLEETVSNIRIVKAYAMEKFEIKKFFKATNDYFMALVRMTRIRHLASPVSEVLIIGAGIVILIYAGTRIIEGGGEMDAGDFMTFIISMFAMIKPVKNLFRIHIKIQEGMAAAERIFGIIDTPVKVKEITAPKNIDQFKSTISYENISFSYNGRELIIDNVSFEVKKGEVVALVGPSGAGKSTLFDLLPRFYDPQQGRITIDGVDIKELKLTSLRNLLGIVTQETYLFNDTIRHNIAYGLENISDDEIISAARAANAHDFIIEFENGYDTIVGNRGVRLSGGQRQRLAIARALLKNPQILIFDEATSALDTESELLVQEAIDRLMKDRTTLVIAHRLSTVINANRIMVIDRGRIVEEGRHEELMKLDGVYHKLYMMQFKNGVNHEDAVGAVSANK